MSQLDLFLARISNSDTREKLALSNEILNYLESTDSSVECDDTSLFIDAIVLWINQSNFRVSQNGLNILGLLVERMKTDFRFYINAVLPHAIDRLGDARDTVREKAQLLLARLMAHTISPQAMFERAAVLSAFGHKNAKVREELLLLLQTVLTDHGADSLQLSKLLPSIVKLLSDPSSPVRDAAFNTLVEIYKRVGQRVRSDLQKKHNVPPSRLAPLLTMFDQVRDSGQMLAATSALSLSSEGSRKDGEDESDRVAVSKQAKSTFAPTAQRTAALQKSNASSNGDTLKKFGSLPRKPTTSGSVPSGGMDESLFIAAFEDVPRLHLYSARDLDEHMVKIRDVIGSASNDWDKRIDALKRVRAVLVAGGSSYDDLDQHLRMLEPALQISVQDLRSQVVREACITIAYLSQQLCQRVDRLCYTLTPTLLDLIPNSAKVMSTSGVVALRFIVQNTHYARLIGHFTGAMAGSKSREIRRACCELLEQMLAVWPAAALERHVLALQEALRRGLQDADAEARSASRRAYWAFADHFKEAADVILNSLEPSQKKALIGEMSKTGSTSSLANNPRSQYGGVSSRSRASSRSGSQENLLRTMAPPLTTISSSAAAAAAATGPSSLQPVRRNVPFSLAKPDKSGTPGGAASCRSSSAIDLQAAQRAKARAQYSSSQRARQLQPQHSLPRPRKPATAVTPSRVPPPTGLTAIGGVTAAGVPRVAGVGTSISSTGICGGVDAVVTRSSPRTPRPRGRITQSQPGSRSSSPSSRLHYATSYAGAETDGRSLHRRRRRSGIPRSTGTSREPSPHRAGNGLPTAGSPHHHPHPHHYTAPFASSHASPALNRQRTAQPRRDFTSPSHTRPLMAHKILLQSREAESALANALASSRSPVSRTAPEDRSDDSETSSVCSERSNDVSARRDRASWHGNISTHSPSQLVQRVSNPMIWSGDQSKHVADMIDSIASSHWSDRKEGLLALQALLASHRVLSASQLSRVTELFIELFMDSHTKVFSIFLDTLYELLAEHHCDLHNWLYPLTVRLFNKLGADLLGSVAQKVAKTLDIIRDRFPRQLQLKAVCRYLLDHTQTPNVKVKAAVLLHLRQLLDAMHSAEFCADLDTPLALAKIISWTSDQKSVEVRNGAKAVLVAMFNVNSAEFTALLGQLSKIYQDSVSEIMQQHVRRRASLDHHQQLQQLQLLRSPGSPMAPSNHGANHGTFPRAGAHRTHPDDTENLNPDELYRSLRRTTAEIQNYSFDDAATAAAGQLTLAAKQLSDTSSCLSPTPPAAAAAPPAAEVSAVCSAMDRLQLAGGDNGGDTAAVAAAAAATGSDAVAATADDSQLFESVLAELSTPTPATTATAAATADGSVCPDQRRVSLLTVVQRLAQHADPALWQKHFRQLLRPLVDSVRAGQLAERELALAAVTELVRRGQPLSALFVPFAELVYLSVLEAQREPAQRPLCRAAELCAAAMAGQLPVDTTVRVVTPMVSTAEFPVNQAAIKTLTRLVEQHAAALVCQQLADIMPALLKAYDNSESSVRKAAVFCMVTIHSLCGEDVLRPHLATLNSTKMKLLNLYIKRAQTQNTAAT